MPPMAALLFYFTEYFATVAFAPCANKDKYVSVTLAVNKLLSGKSSPKIALIASNDWTRAFPSALLCTAF
jgi:polyisoprenoid-binding protein YceI